MKPFALELNERSLALARAGRVLSSGPSAVFDGSSHDVAGANAWGALHLTPTATSTRHLAAVIGQSSPSARSLALFNAELRARLAEHPFNSNESVWIATPAHVDSQGLVHVLNIAHGLGLPMDGFVDAAAVTAAVLRPQRNAVVLDVGLHYVAATAVDSNGQARRRRAVVSERGGLIELYDAWLDLISTAMVKRTRFDPLHNAATEQQLFDALPALANEVAASGGATAHVSVGAERFDVTLSRDQMAEAAQPIYREILRLLHELRPAGVSLALVMPRPVATLPGLREVLESFVGCELIAVPDGFAAAATSMMVFPEAADRQAVRLLRRLPSAEEPTLAALATREILGSQRTAGPAASHVVFEGKAYPLGNLLMVGRAPDAAASIKLPEGLAGVSRRHCALIRDGGEIVLVDHSRHGTRVNGERVAERVRLYAGDCIHVGEPGVELSLLSLAETQPPR